MCAPFLAASWVSASTMICTHLTRRSSIKPLSCWRAPQTNTWFSLHLTHQPFRMLSVCFSDTICRLPGSPSGPSMTLTGKLFLRPRLMLRLWIRLVCVAPFILLTHQSQSFKCAGRAHLKRYATHLFVDRPALRLGSSRAVMGVRRLNNGRRRPRLQRPPLSLRL